MRSIPVKPAEDDELEEEAEWIFRHGFSTLTISMQVQNCDCYQCSCLFFIFTKIFLWPCLLFDIIQESTDYLDRGTTTNFSRKGPSTIAKIKEALNFMRNQLFEVKAVHTFIHLSLHMAWHLPNFSQFCFKVPFIAFYRKEYVEPELNINDLWKVWQWDEKVWRLLLFTLEKTHCSNDKHIPFALFILHLPVDSAEDQEAEPDPAVSKDAVLPV